MVAGTRRLTLLRARALLDLLIRAIDFDSVFKIEIDMLTNIKFSFALYYLNFFLKQKKLHNSKKQLYI